MLNIKIDKYQTFSGYNKKLKTGGNAGKNIGQIQTCGLSVYLRG